MKKTGFFFIFEGPDGVGKSSIIESIANKLSIPRSDIDLPSFPGKSPNTLGGLVYNVHHNRKKHFTSEIPDASIQTLHIAAHIDCILNQIIPALQAGRTIILDRCWWSTYVYGKIQNIPTSILEHLIEIDKFYLADYSPDLIFLITRKIPLKPGEISGEKQWKDLNKEYSQFAEIEKNTGENIIIIENDNSIDEAINDVLKHINKTTKSMIKI